MKRYYRYIILGKPTFIVMAGPAVNIQPQKEIPTTVFGRIKGLFL